MVVLIMLAVQFLTDRNWWQFHSPKNDTMNVLVESCELLEHFNTHEQVTESNSTPVAKEMADVLFASIICAQVNSVDIAYEIGKLSGNSELHDTVSSYNELYELILNDPAKFGMNRHATAREVVLSLVVQARMLSDYFIWYTCEQSIEIAQKKKVAIGQHLALILSHLILLSDKAGIDLPEEYKTKMRANASKYPTNTSSIELYNNIKEQYRTKP